MIITSSAFNDGGTIPPKFTCEGGDMNPELLIQNVPAEAQALALIVHDPDAPMSGGFTHWTVWNIDPATAIIKEESIAPGSVEGENSAGWTGYMGPCPAPFGESGAGPHHYHFQLYALDAPLDLPEAAPVAALRREIEKHTITSAELVGIFGRAKK